MSFLLLINLFLAYFVLKYSFLSRVNLTKIDYYSYPVNV